MSLLLSSLIQVINTEEYRLATTDVNEQVENMNMQGISRCKQEI